MVFFWGVLSGGIAGYDCSEMENELEIEIEIEIVGGLVMVMVMVMAMVMVMMPLGIELVVMRRVVVLEMRRS